MNFQPIDYLSNLNLDFDQEVSPVSNESNNDLDLFGQAEFFDLDVISKDFIAPTKEEQQRHSEIGFKRSHINEFQELPQDIKIEESIINGDSDHFSTRTADEKRKRNTAASARFRIKKKMKEQQMEKQAKDLQDKVEALEKKLKMLETENKCLKSLILQKNDEKNVELLDSMKKKSVLQFSSDFQYTR